MKRRTYLELGAALAAGAAIPLAGCSTAVASVPAPRFPDSRMDGWERIDERRETLLEREIAGRTIQAKAHALVYEDADLRRRIEGALGALGHPVSAVAASRIDFSLDLDRVLDVDSGVAKRAERRARERFESRLSKMGVRNLQRTEAGEVTVETGESAQSFRYVADLSIDPNSIEDTTVPVAADLLTWRHDGSILVAGGVYPAKSPADVLANRPSGATIDLEYDPAAYRDRVREILTGVE